MRIPVPLDSGSFLAPNKRGAPAHRGCATALLHRPGRDQPTYLVRLHVDLRYVVQHVARCERTLELLAHLRVDDGVSERGEHLRSKAVFVLAPQCSTRDTSATIEGEDERALEPTDPKASTRLEGNWVRLILRVTSSSTAVLSWTSSLRSSFGESEGNDVLELFELWRWRYCVGLAGSAEGKRLWIDTSEYSMVTPLSNASASALTEAHQLTDTSDCRFVCASGHCTKAAAPHSVW